MPMRKGYAQNVFVLTSGENMSIHAAANIAMAVDNFRGRGYAKLGGMILNSRGVRREMEKVQELCDDFSTSIIGVLPRSSTVQEAEPQNKTVIEAFPESSMAQEYRKLADAVYDVCAKGQESLCSGD